MHHLSLPESGGLRLLLAISWAPDCQQSGLGMKTGKGNEKGKGNSFHLGMRRVVFGKAFRLNTVASPAEQWQRKPVFRRDLLSAIF